MRGLRGWVKWVGENTSSMGGLSGWIDRVN